MRKFERRAVRAALLRAGTILIAVLAVILFAVFNETVGFRSLLPAYAIPPRQEGEMRVHFLSMGQADCTLVEFPNGEILLVDAGGGTWENNNKIFRYRKGLGEGALSLLLTHIASDHSGGASFVIEEMGAEKLYYPAVFALEATPILTRAEERGAAAEGISRRFSIEAGGAYLTCVSPRAEEEDDENDCSAVLYLRYAGVGILLTGDIGSQREKLLAAEYLADPALFGEDHPAILDDTDILKVAHHGSGDSSCDEWLRLLHAKTAIVSCGAGNPYGHPAPEAMARLQSAHCEIFRTDELGDIMVTISPDGTYTTRYGYL